MKFTDKKVALICPAEHITKRKQDLKDYIIVRLNDSLPLSKKMKEMTGDRTDVLYINPACMPQKEWESLSEIRLRTDGIFEYNNFIKNKPISVYHHLKEKLAIIHPDNYYKIMNEINSEPNMGLIAIADILRENPKELYITGMTFFQTKYSKDYNIPNTLKEKLNKTKGEMFGHNQKAQMEYFKKYFKNLQNVKMDKELSEVVK